MYHLQYTSHLFNIYLDSILKEILGITNNWELMLYADDICILYPIDIDEKSKINFLQTTLPNSLLLNWSKSGKLVQIW